MNGVAGVKTFKATTHSQEGSYGRGDTYVTDVKNRGGGGGGSGGGGGWLNEYTRSKYFLICFVHF